MLVRRGLFIRLPVPYCTDHRTTAGRAADGNFTEHDLCTSSRVAHGSFSDPKSAAISSCDPPLVSSLALPSIASFL